MATAASCRARIASCSCCRRRRSSPRLVREFGGALLAAFEKGDAEYLASLRAGHERELLNLTRAIRQDQWRDADWQRQALQKTKEVAQTNRRYYATLIQNGLNSGELQYQDLTAVSLSTHVAANVIEGRRRSDGSHSRSLRRLPVRGDLAAAGGTKLAGMFKTIARITHPVADMAAQTAGLDLTQAGWARRLEEWVHQVEVLDIEIQQIERQILAAERRRDIALQELNNHQRQIEQSTEVQDFLRDKFTSHELYLYLQKETAALHYKMYELALHAAEQAERAFNFERGDTARRFLPCEPWDNLHEGLLAGERLQLALRTMEKAYLDVNVREYELTKHFSLRLHFPLQFLQLKTTGVCEIELPEWMFDLDYPGPFMRRIKNVTLTIPCVTGPYTGVHCRLTLLSSSIRVDPCLTCPPAACCGRCACENEYEPCRCDPRFVRHFGAREAIATSSGQNDSGMFELNFRDERYLPFEFLGAVSRWRIELPPENNFFDMDTLSDVVLNLNYTAREGGDVLRRAANEVAQCHVATAGRCSTCATSSRTRGSCSESSRRDRECERRLDRARRGGCSRILPCDRDSDDHPPRAAVRDAGGARAGLLQRRVRPAVATQARRAAVPMRWAPPAPLRRVRLQRLPGHLLLRVHPGLPRGRVHAARASRRLATSASATKSTSAASRAPIGPASITGLWSASARCTRAACAGDLRVPEKAGMSRVYSSCATTSRSTRM